MTIDGRLERHPWNTGFTWADHEGSFGVVTEEQARQFGTLRHTYVEPLGWECLTRPAEVDVAPVRAGSMVVFSSLTPHMTGPNTTDQVRKAYILQYWPTGSEILKGEPEEGPPTSVERGDDPSRWLPVTRGGEPVSGDGAG